MAKQKFGSKKHTKRKLDVIDDYHAFYPVALTRKGLRLIYIDAFAGTGEVFVAEEASEPMLPGVASAEEKIEGSAVRALRSAIPYDRYVFIEKSRSKLSALQQQLAKQFPERIARCEFICADANEAIQSICKITDWKRNRAVVFLDPFGNQIAWETLVALAQTRAIDLWYLFPAGLGVYRQIPKEGKPQPKAAESVTRMLGSDEWKFLFTKKSTADDLFDGPVERISRDVSVKEVTAHAIYRLRTIFEGDVLDEYVVLGGKKVPWYSLIFACSNPSDAAKTLAHKVAHWIVTHR